MRFIPLVFLLIPSSALADTCSKPRDAYKKVARYTANAIDASIVPADVQASVGTLLDAAKAVNACLPPLPQTRPTGGGYLVDHNVGSIQECEKQVDALIASPLLDCLAAWDYIAVDKNRLALPGQDCGAMALEFVRVRDELRACHAKYRFNDSTRIKSPLSGGVVKTHGKKDKDGAVCFGAQAAAAEPNLFVSVDDGPRSRFSGATGTVAFESVTLAEPHTLHVFSGVKEVASLPLDFKALKSNFAVLSSAGSWQVAAVRGSNCK